ncbi:MAG: hypothetical protein EOO01_10315 [Chitinophagaceae bacterium]|nr:MAG: hypothetical protein EOO01_10315 [Chitinophagaceae bacterium]
MRYFYTTLLFPFILTSCRNTPTAAGEQKREWLPEPDRNERLLGEAINKTRKFACTLQDPDTSLSGIMLRNALSAAHLIGTNNKPDNKEQYNFYSKQDKETLALTQHPGDRKNQISIFSVSYSDKADHGYKQLNVETFETEKGIKLGMTKEEVLSRLGNCYAVVDSSSEFIELYYRIESPHDSKTSLLQRHHMPVYYASYIFGKNSLRFFEFGFEYP